MPLTIIAAWPTGRRFRHLLEAAVIPWTSKTLVKGVADVRGQKIKFLPKIPVDPMTGTTDWGLKRAGPQGGGIVDVYTKSEATALDGTKYQDW